MNKGMAIYIAVKRIASKPEFTMSIIFSANCSEKSKTIHGTIITKDIINSIFHSVFLFKSYFIGVIDLTLYFLPDIQVYRPADIPGLHISYQGFQNGPP